MTSIETRARKICRLNLIPAGRQSRIRAKIVLARRTSQPRGVQVPAHPVWTTIITTVGHRILRLLHQVIVRLVRVGYRVARISHREMFAGWCRSRRWRREITNLNIVDVDTIRAARDLSDLKANCVGVVDGETCCLKCRRAGGNCGTDLSPGASVVC